MSDFALPRANTPRILAQKQLRCRKILAVSISLSLSLFALFLVSIHLEPRPPFLVSLSLVSAPFLIFFVAALLHAHVKYFPEFDYGSLSPEEIRCLPVSPRYLEEYRKLHKRKTVKFLLIIAVTAAGLYPLYLITAHPDSFPTLCRICTALELLPGACLILLTRSLARDIRNRRQLEFHRYTMT